MISDNNFDRIYNLALEMGQLVIKLLGAEEDFFFKLKKTTKKFK